MPNQTKRLLSNALKTLLASRTVDKITIQELTELADVSRKTFYYHFRDIYDLLEWTLMDDAARLFQEHIDLKDWKTNMEEVAKYLFANRALVLNGYHSVSREVLENYVQKVVVPVVTRYYEDNYGNIPIEAADKEFIIQLFSFGIIGFFLQWIGSGMRSIPHDLINQVYRFLSGSMGAFIRRADE